MKKLIKEQILKLHSMAIKQSDGVDGVRDDGYWVPVFITPFVIVDILSNIVQ